MAALSDADYRSVLRAVGEVSTTTTRDDFDRTALQELGVLVRTDVSSLNEVDPAAARLTFVTEPADYAYPPEAPAVFARLAPGHPLITHYTETGDGSAAKISDFWSAEVWHESPLFQEFYRLLGVEHQISIALPAPMPIVVAFAMSRTDSGADFDERDRAVLNLVRPHLAQAWRRAREYERLAVLAATASSALAATGSGVIVLGQPPFELTPGALMTLYRFFGRPGVLDPLPSRVRRWLDEQHSVPRDRLELARPLRAVLDGRALIVRRLPATAVSEESLLLDEQAARSSTTSLRSVGLSEREAGVLALVGHGSTNAEIARELSLSPWTVKRHLANCYTKLGVRSRAAATAALLEITGHHGLDRPGEAAPTS